MDWLPIRRCEQYRTKAFPTNLRCGGMLKHSRKLQSAYKPTLWGTWVQLERNHLGGPP
jgi:hypothetical protein